MARATRKPAGERQDRAAASALAPASPEPSGPWATRRMLAVPPSTETWSPRTRLLIFAAGAALPWLGIAMLILRR